MKLFGPESLLRSALRRVDARTLTLALLGNAVLLVIGWIWLFIPDSHVWQFALSVIVGLALIAGMLVLYVTLLRRLYRADDASVWKRGLVLAGWLVFGIALQWAAGLLYTHVETRAGLWNSQLGPHHRALVTYDRLVSWQNDGIEFLIWILIPVLLLPFVIETQTRRYRPWRNAAAALSRPQLWLTGAAAYIAGAWTTAHLFAWHPAYSTAGELLSAAMRILLAYFLLTALLLLSLAVVAELLDRQHDRRDPIP